MKHIPNSYKITLAVLGLMIAVICPKAHAQFGSTYQASCTNWGGKGQVDKVHNYIQWTVFDSNSHQYTWTVTAQFTKNRCSMIAYSTLGSISEGSIWQILAKEVGFNQNWSEMAGIEAGVRDFYLTNSPEVLATVWMHDGYTYVRVTTSDWLKRHNLLRSRDSSNSDQTTPPVQEDGTLM